LNEGNRMLNADEPLTPEEPVAQFGSFEQKWVPGSDMDDPSVARARALAHATLVSTSMKVANIRAAAQSTLLDAHTQAEEVLAAAYAQAETIRQEAETEAEAGRWEILDAAHRNATQITDRAFDQRDLLLTATLERIAGLSSELMGMADQIISHAEDPAVARNQLAQFMLALTGMAEQVDTFDVAPPSDAAAISGVVEPFRTGRALQGAVR
jgi:vacuolar-type H+-ATPase subunit H